MTKQPRRPRFWLIVVGVGCWNAAILFAIAAFIGPDVAGTPAVQVAALTFSSIALLISTPVAMLASYFAGKAAAR